MRISVEYFYGEPYEPLNLNKEQCGLLPGPTQVASSRTGTAVDKIVKQVKTRVAKGSLRRLGLETKN